MEACILFIMSHENQSTHHKNDQSPCELQQRETKTTDVRQNEHNTVILKKQQYSRPSVATENIKSILNPATSSDISTLHNGPLTPT